MKTPADRLKSAFRDLPFAGGGLPGVGGEIKAEPEHFQVEEMLPYEPCGDGEHLFVTVRRKQWNTADVAAALGKCFGLKNVQIGWGGRKDKQAVTTQTFSLLLPLDLDLERIRVRLSQLPFEILGLSRHRNKIKTGHVAANRFRILLSKVDAQAFPRAAAIAEKLRRIGVPNFYGVQRFGQGMANIDRAMAMVDQGRPARGKKDDLMVSALQGALFNIWLVQRLARGEGRTVLPGDVAQKADSGGLFVVEDVAEAQQRFNAGAILYTGPIFGPKMKAPAGRAAVHEQQLLASYDLDLATFKRLRAPGARRKALLRLDDLEIIPDAQGLWFAFTLPPGAYATVVMREFLRVE
ncbi:MAG: tRNA pseudouridine(13) synthase TruD [Desulfatitalea sp.]|nr:tRNA pseudouridine(13) synthase TruD [Desulfatitalea sp.]NNK02343.1 tRNA pseudouridine(13) synthase TruD [Desulfatitalea sp.]